MQKSPSSEGTTKLPRVFGVRSWKITIAVLVLLLVVGVAGAFFIRAQKISTLKKTKETLKAGTEYYNKKKLDKAITSLEKTVKLDPNNSKSPPSPGLIL